MSQLILSMGLVWGTHTKGYNPKQEGYFFVLNSMHVLDTVICAVHMLMLLLFSPLQVKNKLHDGVTKICIYSWAHYSVAVNSSYSLTFVYCIHWYYRHECTENRNNLQQHETAR